MSANPSRSNNEGRAKALLLSAPESTPSSLKFTTRLLTESTWQACAQANSQPRTTSCCCLNQGLESHCLCIHNQGSWGRADLWMHTYLSVHQWCCWVGTLRASWAEMRASVRWSSGLPGFYLLFSECPPECVCLPDFHVEPQLGSSLSTQELMTRLCFLLGEVTPGTASSPMEDRREKKVGQHIDLVALYCHVI